MAPQPYPAPKLARNLASSSSTSSPSTDAVINIVFGLCAVGIGAVTVWQTRKAWRIWRGDHRRASQEAPGDPPNTDIDLEPNLIGRPSSEQTEHVSVYTPSAIGQEFDHTSANEIVGGLTDPFPSSNSVTHSTSQGMMITESTSNEEVSLSTNAPLGCRPVLEDLRL